MNLYFVSGNSNSLTPTYSAYIMGEENVKRSVKEMLISGCKVVSVWKAHFTPDGILTYGGVCEMHFPGDFEEAL